MGETDAERAERELQAEVREIEKKDRLRNVGTVGLSLALVGLLVGAAVASTVPAGEVEDCVVTDVSKKQSRRSIGYTVQTSCGQFGAPGYIALFLEVGEEYDFTLQGWPGRSIASFDQPMPAILGGLD